MNQQINPFENIMGQMNQAKASYDQTMNTLQQQLNAARQAAAVYQAPNLFNQQADAPQQQAAPPSPEAVPANVQQLTALGEIKSLLKDILGRLPEAAVKDEVKQVTAKSDATHKN